MRKNDDLTERAWQHYVSLDSEDYERANWERTKDGRVDVSRYGSEEHSVTLLAGIKIDPETGRSMSGHEYDPEARSMKDIEAAFGGYLTQTPPERRLVIFEGDERLLPSREEAVRTATESGLIQFLAAEKEVPAVSGEPSDLKMAEILEKQGVSRKELAALYATRSIAGSIRGDPEQRNNLGPMIHYQAGKVGLEGFEVLDEEEKQRIGADGRTEEVLSGMSRKAESLVPVINELVREQFGRDLLLVKDGKIQLSSEAEDAEDIDREIAPLWNPVLPGELNKVAMDTSTVRDRYLFEQIITAYEQGKSPFVPYGGSHIVCLKPAVEAYFSGNKQA